VPELDLSGAGVAQNSLFLFESLLSTLELPSVGGDSTTAETVDSARRQMVCEEERSHHSLRSTFETGGVDIKGSW
jgi:hypothetical protein